MKRKKILILGSTGMLGHMVYMYLKENAELELHDISFRNQLNEKSVIVDVTNFELLNKTIDIISPDFIINCIGILIKGAETNPANAIHLNALLPHHLSAICKILGIRIIHISTDCVFSGSKGGYREDEFRDADDIYGRSKALGELINDRDITLRTSIIGPELKSNGEGLFHWFLSQKGQVFGFENAYWSGVTTLELAKQIKHTIDNPITGLIQIAPKNKISKLHLLILIKEVFGLDAEIIPKTSKWVDKSLIASNGFIAPDYTEMLDELREFMLRKENLYKAYLH